MILIPEIKGLVEEYSNIIIQTWRCQKQWSTLWTHLMPSIIIKSIKNVFLSKLNKIGRYLKLIMMRTKIKMSKKWRKRRDNTADLKLQKLNQDYQMIIRVVVVLEINQAISLYINLKANLIIKDLLRI